MASRRHWLLYVEDNEDDVELVRQLLPAADYPVVWAPTAEAARERLETTKFDLVLLDHGLPDTNSLLFLEEIRSLDPRLPVVVLTGRNDEALVISANRKGAIGFLLKDDVVDRLQPTVDAALRAGEEERERWPGRAGSGPEESRLYGALLSMMNEGCVLVDVDGVVTFANEASGRMLGLPADEILGRRAGTLWDDATRKRFLDFHERVVGGEGRASVSFEGRLRPDDSGPWPAGRPVLLSARSVVTEMGEGEVCLAVIADISELVEARNTIRSRLAELERFQRLFVDRESRILELKNQIREYERRLGIESSGLSEETRLELERRLTSTGGAEPHRPTGGARR